MQNVPAPSVSVVVISAISTDAVPLSQFQLQVAVPKVCVCVCVHAYVCEYIIMIPPVQVMRVKLQPPTGTDLAAFNPMLPPTSISQIMLLANPAKVSHLMYSTALSMQPPYMYVISCHVESMFILSLCSRQVP